MNYAKVVLLKLNVLNVKMILENYKQVIVFVQILWMILIILVCKNVKKTNIEKHKMNNVKIATMLVKNVLVQQPKIVVIVKPNNI